MHHQTPSIKRGLAFALTAAAFFPASALAVTDGTASLTGGTLTLVAPATVAFAATLTGADQTVDSTVQALQVLDQTGSAAGWNVTATSTTFTSPAGALPAAATTMQAEPTVACDAGSTCTLPVTDVVYPYSLPSAPVTAPTATKLYSATAGTGVGNQTATGTFQLAVPGSATAGAYTATWTYSLISAP